MRMNLPLRLISRMMAPVKVRTKTFGRRTKNSGIENLDRSDLLADQTRTKTADNGFNFRQFGHGIRSLFGVGSLEKFRLRTITGDEPFQLPADPADHADFMGLEAGSRKIAAQAHHPKLGILFVQEIHQLQDLRQVPVHPFQFERRGQGRGTRFGACDGQERSAFSVSFLREIEGRLI